MSWNILKGAGVVGDAHCVDNFMDEMSNLADDCLQVVILPQRQIQKHQAPPWQLDGNIADAATLRAG
jgi:hypothetical protein